MLKHDQPTKLKGVEFYITNVCNLTCKNCNRFNNYDFKGWQRWEDHAEEYAQWAQLVDFENIYILGGEPLLNPTIKEWCQGIRQLWPKSGIQIVTNGYQLNRVPDLYKTVSKNGILLFVTLHNEQEEEFVYGEIEKFLTDPRKEQHAKDSNVVLFHDHNNVGIWSKKEYHFVTSSMLEAPNGHLTLHHSDPQRAHDQCTFVQHKSYHFIRGKLYKCGPVALFPEFDKQHPLHISDQDRELINSYRPYSAQDFATDRQRVLNEIDQPLPQCKFCPQRYGKEQIFPVRKGKHKTINIANRS